MFRLVNLFVFNLPIIVMITDLGMPNILNQDFVKRWDQLFFEKPRIEDALTFKFYMLRFPYDLTTNPKKTSGRVL